MKAVPNQMRRRKAGPEEVMEGEARHQRKDTTDPNQEAEEAQRA